MKLLIVENEPEQVQLYLDVIESFNKTSEIQIIPDPYDSLETGQKAIKDNYYDAAIIDLKLASGTPELQGMEIVNSIIDNLRFPVFIVSGSIGQIDKPENALFKKRLRDTDFKGILEEIVGIYKTGITKILGKKGEISEYLTKIFWNHLSNSIDIWIEDEKRTPDEKHKSLLRYTLLHIQEYLELTEESGFEDYHPAEVYITPVIKPNVFTGDLVNKNGTDEYFIVLTPSCDLAQTKAKDILLVNLEPTNSSIINEKVKVITKNKASSEVIEESEIILQNLIHNTYSNKYHFLPKYKEINGGLINFQKLNAVRVKEFNNNFNRVASINSGFTKDIVARFSYYYSRQGSPDFNHNEIYESLFK